jgi:UPF0716 family protein affecting phage T7 exclusion
MISRLKLFALLLFGSDVILLAVMVHYTSWLFMFAFVLFSSVIGGWILNDGLRYYIRNSRISMNDRILSGEDFMIGAVARFAAGILLIVPGVLTDILALLLLSPAGKWLTKVFFVSLFIMLAPRFSHNEFNFSYSENKPAKDEIIDVKVVNPDDNQLKNE